MKESVDSVLRWLSKIDYKWLLIFDNADGSPNSITQYLPTGRHGNVLITSRNQNLRSIVAPNAWAKVDQMTEDESISLLSKAAHLDACSDETGQMLRLIVAELGFLALAIDQAGAAIASGVCTVDDYLQVYSKHRQELIDHPALAKMAEYGSTVYGTWEVSYKAIQKSSRRASEPVEARAAKIAIIILQAIAFFHHDNIMEEIVKRAAESDHSLTHGQNSDRNVNLRGLAVTYLSSSSTLTRNDAGTNMFLEKASESY